ncbi:hypothetical protein BDV23DRAFT_145854 [Aspergillus alliaceus]|uniref:Ubiquitin thioesterase OTU n=1 Tax=Petromyces alliaceus TaxID=209559 RepID=A0A5N7CNX0_PETAA|nr:uncharacterized protein BDW43DRAFT_265785 [Aspergillus alliaceus]KAB8236730.1 hypothetical protein BDW43DRAFT_265785 [Aspergillus alliaceus]KAE8395398.1 hypothetical protein BDV23DRAFT_145854 [Aspergillus alliaceus]
MRFRIRGPDGQSTVSLDDHATVDDLRTHIVDKTGLTSYDVKYGYPDLKHFPLDEFQPNQMISDVGITLNGEQLLITKKEGWMQAPLSRDEGLTFTSQELPEEHPVSHESSDAISDDPPEIPSSEHAGTFVLRIMPDDNSCMFRAVGSALMGGMDAMNELRSVVAQTIQENPDIYSEAVLEKKPDDYCRWIHNEDSWGGGIELSIISKHFDIEICSIDVQTLRIDRFNEGPPTRCILVYSGIHYDTVALSPSDHPFIHAHAPPEFDTKVFDSTDNLVLEKALELCKVLQSKHYYTDTAGFRIRCNTCGRVLIGEKGATQHATQTGHYSFGEAG